MQPPNDVRHFFHRRLIGAATGFVTGGPLGALAGLTKAQRGRARRAAKLSPNGQRLTGPNRTAAGCVAGSKYNARTDTCELPRSGVVGAVQRFLPGGASGFEGGTRAGSGIYAPELEALEVRRCFPGDILGKDGFCHAKGSIPNKERAHPRGRRPLGTPGEMAALAKAASFGKRMESTVKRMQKIGVLKKPHTHRPRLPRQKLLGPGGTSIINVE